MMAGCALSQSLYGPMSEGIGRKKTLIIGSVLSVIGSIVCTYSKHINSLNVGMFILGVGIGSGSLYRCIFSDCYSGKQLSERGAYATLLYSLMVPCATLIGGFIQDNFYWQANFTVLVIAFCANLVFIIVGYGETNAHMHPSKLQPAYIKRMYALVLNHTPFRGYGYCTLLTNIGYFAWMTTSPIYIIKMAGWSPSEYGKMMLYVSLISMFIGGMINSIAIKYLSVRAVLSIGWIIVFLLGLTLVVTELIYGFSPNIIIACMFMHFLAGTLLWPNYYIEAFAPFHEQSGYANAAYSSMQLIGASLSAFILAPLPEDTAIPLGIVIMITIILSVINHYVCVVMHPGLENSPE